MSQKHRTRQQQLFRQAEGYLELAVAFDDRWSLEEHLRVSMANRCLQCLDQIGNTLNHRAHILYLKGQAFRMSGRYVHAIDALERAWQLDRRNLHTCLALGWCYKRTGDLAAAIESLQQAIEVDPRRAIVHYNLACYLALAKQKSRAIEHLATAFELNADYRELVDSESDFDAIRNDPDFLQIRTVSV